MLRTVSLCAALLAAGCNLFTSADPAGGFDVDVADDVAIDDRDVGATDMSDQPDLIDDAAAPDAGDDAGCVPESDQQLCERLVVNCDTITAQDNCGTVRTAACGSCTSPAVCGGGGTPNVCACEDQSDVEFCADRGATCGSVTDIDVCDLERTVSCGSCTDPEECVDGTCVCVPETDMELCAALDAECGTATEPDRCGNTRTIDCGMCGANEMCVDNECLDDPCPNGTCDATEDATSCPQDCGAVAIATGALHSCAVREDGTLLCWGSDSEGQLGNGGTSGTQPPTAVSFPAGVAVFDVAASGTLTGLGTCAATSGGTFCWGNGAAGQNGVGSNADQQTPQLVDAQMPTAIGVGSEHRCFATSSSASCWGEAQYGRLGTGAQADQQTPATVTELSDVVLHFAPGDRHTCAILAGGTVECVGSNLNGQQGNGISGSGNFNLVGEDVGLTSVSHIASGHDHTCAVADDDVYCWGVNDDGQIGNATNDTEPTPVLVHTLPGALALTAATSHTCVVDTDNDLTCWGENRDGELAMAGGGELLSPTAVALPFDVIDVSAGDAHTCAIATDQTVWCWGDNASGQLGDPAAASGPTPLKVAEF